jgi:hypothetical protein
LTLLDSIDAAVEDPSKPLCDLDFIIGEIDNGVSALINLVLNKALKHAGKSLPGWITINEEIM